MTDHSEWPGGDGVFIFNVRNQTRLQVFIVWRFVAKLFIDPLGPGDA
jgi:hypothetical protein